MQKEIVPIQVRVTPDFPEHTALLGNQLFINIGGQSPDWVLELCQSEMGVVKLLMVLRQLIERQDYLGKRMVN